jgi:hypothetical protein
VPDPLVPDLFAVDLVAVDLVAVDRAALLVVDLADVDRLAVARVVVDLLAAAGLLAVDRAAAPRRAAAPFPVAVVGVPLAPLLAPPARFAELAAGGVRDCAMSSVPPLRARPGGPGVMTAGRRVPGRMTTIIRRRRARVTPEG